MTQNAPVTLHAIVDRIKTHETTRWKVGSPTSIG